VYHTLKEQFAEYIRKNAWWKATHTEANDRSIGDYIDHCKNCDNCYMMSESEDCLNACRAHAIKSSSLTIGSVTSEKLYMSTIAQDHCFNVSHSYNLTRCKNMEYSMNCIDCEDCFLCAGLVGKRYHILNKEFSPETYQTEKERIITDMKNKGMYSEFFPGYFAPTGYDESAS
jgi:hypothetical protein